MVAITQEKTPDILTKMGKHYACINHTLTMNVLKPNAIEI